MKLFVVLSFHVLIMNVSVNSVEYPFLQQQEYGINQVDEKIHICRQMSFLNQNLLNTHTIAGLNEKEDLLEKLKFRKFTSNKIDMTNELRQIQKSLQETGTAKTSQQTSAKQVLLKRLNTIQTVSIASKRFQGLNFYTHIVLELLGSFYSLEGQKVFSLPSQQISNLQSRNKKFSLGSENSISSTMVSSTRNQKIFIAQYVESESLDRNCIDMKILQVQLRKREFIVSRRPQSVNLIIQSLGCRGNLSYQESFYTSFFTYSSYHSKRLYYILANSQQIHFYFYSQIEEQLVQDHNKTISVTHLHNHTLNQGQIDDKPRIQKVIKLNTYLIILTSNNEIISINLLNLFGKKAQYISFYETLPFKFQKAYDIKFSDNDYKHFYLVTQKNIYMYQVSASQIKKKFPLRHSTCKSREISDIKCIQNVWVLENFIMLQQKYTIENKRNHHDYHLIEKHSGIMQKLTIPFSHQQKCSNHKRILLSKNKNSHYILTLACFINTNTQTTKNYSTTNTQNLLSSYLILQHLNLQTSGQINSSSDGDVDFTKFRLPMIVFSIGLICYITIKRSSKKTPEKIAQEEKQTKKFQEEILTTIRREKERQQALKLVRK